MSCRLECCGNSVFGNTLFRGGYGLSKPFKSLYISLYRDEHSEPMTAPEVRFFIVAALNVDVACVSGRY
jgi:hypothetical protein